MKIILGLLGLLLFIIFAFVFSQNYLRSKSVLGKNAATVTINKQKFTAEVAKTPSEKQTGLSNKKSLPQDQGMLFVFDTPDLYPFWMKNMAFPIDMIFINKDKVVTVYQDLQPAIGLESPEIYQPDDLSDRMLEINAGLSQKYNIKPGDSVTIVLP
ncbi:MAG: DUF192 domain-containing protein [Candidatus Levybacteria bacterium]|nr:DUF192 domain-containing protein [Candidatus Levybacteria bacterium]